MTRRAGLTDKAKKHLRPERYCAGVRCYRAPVHIGRCGTHAKAHMDAMLRATVVSSESECEAAEWHAAYLGCGGPLQVNHMVRREYLRVRWDRRNVFAACRDFYLWTERHPLEAERIFREWRGEEYETLRREAVAPGKVDYTAALIALSGIEAVA